MHIFSIKDLVEATNRILNPNKNNKENNTIKKLEINKKKKIIKKSTIGNNIIKTKSNIDYNIKIKPLVKNQMIDELYIFLKKKVKKNTLKIIIDEQVEIRNLNNKISFLKSNKIELLNNYKELDRTYNKVSEKLKKLKDDYEEIFNQNQTLINKNQNLIIENSELKLSLKAKEQKEITINQKNRSFEINNSELKNTVSRYISNTKKLEKEIIEIKNLNELEISEKNNKIKFYQDENVRLSGELISIQRKNENIKLNLTDIELEKQKISDKIKELNKSIEEKTNIVSTTFSNAPTQITNKDNEEFNKLNETEQKSLDEVINRIFKKI